MPESRISHDKRQALRAGYGDIEPILAEEEFQAADGFVAVAGAHGDYDDRRFLSLEFVDGAGMGAHVVILQDPHLHVVGCHHQDVGRSDWAYRAIVAPQFAFQQLRD